MFKPDIFLVVSRNSEYNTPSKFGEYFYISNFYYVKETINHFTQVNENLNPTNALIVAELSDIITLVLNYLEFKNDNNKIELKETQSSIYDNKNVFDFVIKLLMLDIKDYTIEDNSNQNSKSSMVLLIEFIFKYLGIKINDQELHNFNINEEKLNITFNNTYVQFYLESNNVNKENISYNRNNLICYKKMILNVMNCLNKILSLLIIYIKRENQKNNSENANDINKYNKIYFINKLYRIMIENKDIPHYIY
jgi:hypothetical protein